MADNIVLIDGDIICYSAAFSVQTTTLIYEGKSYKNKTELKKKLPNYDKEAVETFIELEPVSHAIQCARMMVDSMLAACAPVESYKGWVTGKGNYREKIATLLPYKGNRVAARPIYYQDVRDYLIAECNIEEVCGVEADDMLCIEYLKNPKQTIVCTLDKDIYQVEGIRIYNWRKKAIVTVDPLTAKRNFYTQLLTGDDTDNIPGVEGIGDAKAEKMLANVKDEKVMMTVCYAAYQKVYGKSAWSALCENAKLLWMLRDERDLLNPANAWKPCLTPGGV